MTRNADKKLGKRKGGTYGRTHGPSKGNSKRAANKGVRREAKLQVNDFVRILQHPEEHPNARARVVKVESDSVRVSNLNMPFCGSYVNELFLLSQVKKEK